MKTIFYKGLKTKFSYAIFWFQMWKLRKVIPDWEERKKIAIYTHVEDLLEPNRMYSSSEVDGGVRSKHMTKFKDHWEFVELDVSKECVEFLKKWYEDRKHPEFKYQHIPFVAFWERFFFGNYNNAGIAFAQVLGTNWFLQKFKWFCSDANVKSKQDYLKVNKNMKDYEELKPFIGVSSHMVSPADLYLMLK